MSRLVEFVVLLLCISSSSPTLYKYSAASPAQIKFAEENNYDNTGPGAKELEAAFNTFSKLEDALLSYFDDPDTKLPEQERIKALTTLYRKGYSLLKNSNNNQNEYIKTDLANDVFAPKSSLFDKYPEKASVMIPKLAVPFVNNQYDSPTTEVEIPEENDRSYANTYAAKSKVSISYNDFDPKPRYTVYHSRFPVRAEQKQHMLHKLHSIKANPVNLAHYSKDTFEPVSQFSYSYGVQGKDTNHYQSPFQDQILESSQPASSRGIIGYYTYMDAEGKRRTVQYLAPNNNGFRSNLNTYFNLKK